MIYVHFRLSPNALQSLRMQLVPFVARNCNQSRFGWMLQLSMAALRANDFPTIVTELFKDVPYVHFT